MKKIMLFFGLFLMPFLMEGQTRYGSGAGTQGGGGCSYFGANAGNENTGLNCTMIGINAGRNHQTGLSDTYIGNSAGRDNQSGFYNTFVGFQSGVSYDGYHSVILGANAGRNGSGDSNILIGNDAGSDLDDADDNVLIGASAGHRIAGDKNILIGDHAGFYGIAMSHNVFIGDDAGRLISSSTSNTFIGHKAGGNKSEGYRNSFLGAQAGEKNQSGIDNTFIGFWAGRNNSGSGNVFIGNEAGNNNQIGSNKLCIDNSSTLSPLIYGDFATDALTINGTLRSTGDFRVDSDLFVDVSTGKIGINDLTPSYSLDVNGTIRSTGDLRASDNLFVDVSMNRVGINTDNPQEDIHMVGNIQIGDDVVMADMGLKTLGLDANFIPQMSNIRSLGSTSKRWRNLYYSNNLYQISDKRLKSNIQDMGYGMKEIMKFRPVTYTIKDDPEANTELGLLAQDVQPIIEEVVCTSEMVTDEKTGQQKSVPTEYLAVNYVELIPVLIKGMQEQQTLIAEQKTLMQEQQTRIERLETLLSETTPSSSDSEQKHINDSSFNTAPKGKVFQNNPNPFKVSTVIGYELPPDVNKAYLTISDMNGVQLKNHQLNNVQKTGQITVSANGLPNGVYVYALTVDGTPVASGKMMVAK